VALRRVLDETGTVGEPTITNGSRRDIATDPEE